LAENELNSKFSSKFVSNLYEKLARTYYLRSRAGDTSNAEGLLSAAFNASTKAVSINQMSHFSWNTLGIVAQGKS